MLKFIMVQGHVVVDYLKDNSREMARNGLELDESGNYLIATAQGSKAEILASGRTISLGPSSFLRISRDRTWIDKPYASWTRDLKTFVGKIWYRLAGDPRDPQEGHSGGGGIRGLLPEVQFPSWLFSSK